MALVSRPRGGSGHIVDKDLVVEAQPGRPAHVVLREAEGGQTSGAAAASDADGGRARVQVQEGVGARIDRLHRGRLDEADGDKPCGAGRVGEDRVEGEQLHAGLQRQRGVVQLGELHVVFVGEADAGDPRGHREVPREPKSL